MPYFSSNDLRRRLAARLQDPLSSLSRLGADETVDLGAGLTPWRLSPHNATARRRRTAAEQEVANRFLRYHYLLAFEKLDTFNLLVILHEFGNFVS